MKPTEVEATHLEVTKALRAFDGGSREAFRQLVEMVYGELRRLAHQQLRKTSRSGLQTTALVNELYLKLAARQGSRFENRGHFFAACATAMRHILIDEARARTRHRRGGGVENLPLSEDILPESGVAPDAEWLVSIDLALRKLSEEEPRLTRVFECRYFAGYSSVETAKALGVSKRTVDRDWQKACAWLRVLLDSNPEESGSGGASAHADR